MKYLKMYESFSNHSINEEDGESVMDYKNVCSIFQKWMDNTEEEDVMDMMMNADVKYDMDSQSKMKKFDNAEQYIAYSLLNYETGDRMHYNSNGRPLDIEEFNIEQVKAIANELVQSIYPKKVLFK